MLPLPWVHTAHQALSSHWSLIFNSGSKQVPPPHTLWQWQGTSVAGSVFGEGSGFAIAQGATLTAWVLIHPQNKRLLLYSHHGDVDRHQGDVSKLRAVAVQLQLPALAQLGNQAQHWRREGGGRERGHINHPDSVARLQLLGGTGICLNQEPEFTQRCQLYIHAQFLIL